MGHSSPFRRRSTTARHVVAPLIAALVVACYGDPVDEAPTGSGDWETLESKVEACNPWSTDLCARIICSIAATLASCVPSDGSSLCATTLECADAYYRCTCPGDVFDIDVTAQCSQAYDDCLLGALYPE